MFCIHCKKEYDEKYIIDAKGNRYCSEDCMEQYMEANDISFPPYPYEDTYLMLRNSYIELLDGWESTLNRATIDLEDAVDELMEEIDSLIEDHYDFILSEGDDGPYAWEIYQYTNKLKELQQRIFAWRPNRKTLYWITSDHGNYGDLGEAGEEVYQKICTDLYLAGYEEFILYVTEHLQHPYHWGLNYIFDNLEMAQEAYEVLLTVCDKHGVDLRMVNAHKCEAHCRDILEADADTYVNGWFYCYSCKESDHHGVYSVDELDEWIRYYNENETDRQILIHEREEWCFPFKKKIRRSCRTWERELPEWAI
ncbi:hypothetical protein [Cohnella massiliensis]|uniref:hypothetical protein n=1 Tax=Cohnella massiliensis TaxID=1816691 RepID=UPI0009B9B79F|nr:hypothetical protein [Cohnella massiliensis]